MLKLQLNHYSVAVPPRRGGMFVEGSTVSDPTPSGSNVLSDDRSSYHNTYHPAGVSVDLPPPLQTFHLSEVESMRLSVE